MRPHLPRYTPVIAIAAACLLIGSTGGAVAGSLVTGKQIKDNTVTTKDIKNKTLTKMDLAPTAVKSLQGKTGAPGPAGTAGAAGAAGAAGRNAWETIPAGTTVTGYMFNSGRSGTAVIERIENVNLPGKAPSAPTAYGFGADAFAQTTTSPACAGTFNQPTAPPGQVCVYLDGLDGFSTTNVYSWDALSTRTQAFYLSMNEEAINTTYYYYGVWAYTAP